MAEEELELDVNQSKGSKMTTILLIVLIVLVLVVGGVGAWFYFASADDEAASSGSSAKPEKVLGPVQYLTLVPEFIVNFGPGSKVRFLQVDLQIATRDEAALVTVNTYRPVLRNDILVILSGLSFDDLKDRKGKEALRMKILNTINKVVVTADHATAHGASKEDNSKKHAVAKSTEHSSINEHVEGPIENVYFTSFIMQ